jgi:hypothetical protein
MKSLKLVSSIIAIAAFALPAAVRAQDTDKDKLIAIEKAFADNANPGDKAAEVSKQYLYDGAIDQLTPMGHIGVLPKTRLVELSSKPDPSDPNVNSVQKLSDFNVELYGSTALVSYKQVTTDTGHKDAALNVSFPISCLDTFVKRNTNWYLVGSACSPGKPISQAARDALQKSFQQQPKDVQQAFH